MSKVLVTGGAGFIGSHIVDALLQKNQKTTVIDNFSMGSLRNIEHIKNRIRVIKGDLRNLNFTLKKVKDFDIIFHLVANYSVEYSSKNPIFDFNSNALTTLHVLEAMRKNNISKIVFTSSSTVYGEAEKFPIPENAQLNPISNYGVSKVAGEMYIHSYSELYGFDALVLRLANIIGPRCKHGVIPDFVKKLNKNPNKLLILGDGKQKKSFLHVKDCVDAIFLTLKNVKRGFDVFNIGSEEWITVDEIARIVCDEMGLKNVKFEYTGGKKGWLGDVSKFLLDIKKLKNSRWRKKYNTEQSIRETVEWLIDNSR